MLPLLNRKKGANKIVNLYWLKSLTISIIPSGLESSLWHKATDSLSGERASSRQVATRLLYAASSCEIVEMSSPSVSFGTNVT